MIKFLIFFLTMFVSVDAVYSQIGYDFKIEKKTELIYNFNDRESINELVYEKIDSGSLTFNDSFQLPKFNLHLALGGVSGVRIGLRSHISQNISLELSAGIPITHFIGGGEKEERYSLGINWHQSIKSGLMFSLICSNIVQPNKSYLLSIPNNRFFSYLRLSGYAGYHSSLSSYFEYFIRGGVVFFESVYFKKRDNKFTISPAFDIGIGWSFSF